VAIINNAVDSEMTESEARCLFDNFASTADLISRGMFRGCLFNLYNKIRMYVKTATARSVAHSGYYFGAPLCNNAYGQEGTVLQHVQYHCQMLCAKVGDASDLSYELQISNRVHAAHTCPTVMKIVTMLDVPHSGGSHRAALICPLYSGAVASHSPGTYSLTMLVNIALCTLSSIAAFQNVGLSHNDIKPANLMFTSTSQMVTLIDFGSTVGIGKKSTSRGISPYFGRDCPPGSCRYDFVCLASTLYVLHHDDGADGVGCAALAASIRKQSVLSVVDEMILECLCGARDDPHAIFTSWVKKVDSARGQLEERALVDYSTIWPAPAPVPAEKEV
jgi:hypothetical protein